MLQRLFGKTFYRIHINGADTCIASSDAGDRGFEKTQTTEAAHRHYLTKEVDPSVPNPNALIKLKAHKNHDDLVEPAVCYRGDSRFPWKIWESGGLFAKGRGSEQYNVQLHQACPSSGQDVVSTSNNPQTGRKYATAWGAPKDRNFPTLKLRDQSETTWLSGQGYSHALWVENGISLEQVNRTEQEFSYSASVQQKYAWEDEVAVLEGLHRSQTLAIRETKDVGKWLESVPTYQATAYIDRRLVLGKARELENQQGVTEKIFEELFEITPELLPGVLQNIQDQIESCAATVIQRAWKAQSKKETEPHL